MMTSALFEGKNGRRVVAHQSVHVTGILRWMGTRKLERLPVSPRDYILHPFGSSHLPEV